MTCACPSPCESSDPGAGILPKDSDDPNRYRRGYADGEYLITLPAVSTFPGNLSNQVETVLPGSYGDASLAIEMRLDNPSIDQFVNLGCRSHDPTSQYRLTIFPASGMFQLVRWMSGQPWTLTGVQAVPTIHRGSETNLLELSCHGPVIESSINGERVASITDYTFQAGQLWIGVGQSSNPVSGAVRTSPRHTHRRSFQQLGRDPTVAAYSSVSEDSCQRVRANKCGMTRQSARSEVFERFVEWASQSPSGHRAILAAAGNEGGGLAGAPGGLLPGDSYCCPQSIG
jgi:hypothetical protein